MTHSTGYRARMHVVGYGLAVLAGAVLGTAWDRIHVYAGTLTYVHPGRFGQPWWVPVEFGAAFAVGCAVLMRRGLLVPDRRSWLRAGVETVFFSGVYGLSGLLWRRPEVLLLVLVVLLVVRGQALALAGGKSVGLALGLVIGGPLVEAGLSTAGLFSYTKVDLFSFPVWLPLLYMLVLPFVVRLAEALLWSFGVRRKQDEPAAAASDTAADKVPERDGTPGTADRPEGSVEG